MTELKHEENSWETSESDPIVTRRPRGLRGFVRLDSAGVTDAPISPDLN